MVVTVRARSGPSVVHISGRSAAAEASKESLSDTDDCDFHGNGSDDGEDYTSDSNSHVVHKRSDTILGQAGNIKPQGPSSRKKKGSERKMGGLSLPDVVRELLKERNVVRWDPVESLYEVLNGEQFEARFNDLRRVRNKGERSGNERPFSRMHNFFALEVGDKWARTGTKFRPLGPRGFPPPEVVKQSEKRQSNSHGNRLTANSGREPMGRVNDTRQAYSLPERMSDPSVYASPRFVPAASPRLSSSGGHHMRRASSEMTIPVRAHTSLGKRSNSSKFEHGHSDDETDVDTSIPSAHQGSDDADFIPPHLIDVVAERLLFKRPRAFDHHTPVGSHGRRDFRYDPSVELRSSFESAMGPIPKSGGYQHPGVKFEEESQFQAEFHRERIHRSMPSPCNSYLAAPSFSESASSLPTSSSTLPAWLLKEAEAAAVAAAAADRRVARYLGLLGAAVGADVGNVHAWSEHSEPFHSLAFDSPIAQSIRRSATELCGGGQRVYRPAMGNDFRSFVEADLCRGADGPTDSEIHAQRRFKAHPRGGVCVKSDEAGRADDDVCEVSSEGGSCQPSPEAPVLSLCGDLDEDEIEESLTPLDLGNPAIDPSAARHTPRTMVPEAATMEVEAMYPGSALGVEVGRNEPSDAKRPGDSAAFRGDYAAQAGALDAQRAEEECLTGDADLRCLFGAGSSEFAAGVDGGDHWLSSGCASDRGTPTAHCAEADGGGCLRGEVEMAPWDALHTHADGGAWW